MDEFLPQNYRWADDHEHKPSILPAQAVHIPVARTTESAYGHADMIKRLAVPVYWKA